MATAATAIIITPVPIPIIGTPVGVIGIGTLIAFVPRLHSNSQYYIQSL